MSKLKLTVMAIVVIAIVALSHLTQTVRTEPLLIDPAAIRVEDLGDFPGPSDGIAIFQGRVRQNPKDAVSLAILGELYVKRARERGDVADYQRAEVALIRALELLPAYTPAQVSLAETYYNQHNFLNALALSEQLYQGNSRRSEALAISGDSHLALGHYAEAEAAYQRLFSQDTSPPVLARMAHLAELKGDPAQALYLMQRAAGEAVAVGQSRNDVAWYLIRLADLYFKAGQPDEAGEHYQAALTLVEGHYVALAGLGKVKAAQEQYEEAIDLYRQSAARIPRPEVLAALGDLYKLTGQPEQAQQQYDTVMVIGQLAQLDQQVYNRQLALFYADHNIHLDEALALALAELETRQDIYGYDAAAWAYYKTGQLAQAQTMIEQGMKLGAQEAMLFYHAGMIARAQGKMAQAERLLNQALAINPHFDLLQASIARSALNQLQRD